MSSNFLFWPREDECNAETGNHHLRENASKITVNCFSAQICNGLYTILNYTNSLQVQYSR